MVDSGGGGKPTGNPAIEAIRESARKAKARLPKPTKPYSGADSIAAARMRAAKSLAIRTELAEKWSPWEGTPETNEKIASVPKHRREWPLDRMARLGTIDADELAAGAEICSILEMIQRAGSVGAASLEARVDNSGSSRDALIESLNRIRMEVAYTKWRKAIPNPAMVLEMVSTNASYVKVAKAHGIKWKLARRMLISALRMWPRFRSNAQDDVDEDTVEAVYRKIGEGMLLAPKPKAGPTGSIADDEAR